MAKKIVIHIGAHKTGSTSIQKFFYEYHQYFFNNKILYPIKYLTKLENYLYGQHFIPWYLINYPVKYDLKKGFDQFLKDINEPFDLVLSSEDFMRLEEKHIENFTNILFNKFEKIYTVIYVSPQVRTIVLAYQTAIVYYKYTEDFKTYLERNIDRFDYYKKIKLWQKSGCEVIVKPYDRSLFEKGDINVDFFYLLREFLNAELKFPENYDFSKFKDVNQSLPDFLIPIFKYYNSKINTKKELFTLLRKLGFKLRKYLPNLTTTDFISPSDKKFILEYYRKSNELLCQEFLGENFIKFMNPCIEMDENTFVNRFGYEGAHLTELLKAVNQAFEVLETKLLEEKDER